MLLKVQITMIWTTQVERIFEKKVGANALPIVGGIFVVVGTLFMMVLHLRHCDNSGHCWLLRGCFTLAGILVGIHNIILTFVRPMACFLRTRITTLSCASIKKSAIVLFSRSSSVCCRGYLVYCHYAASLFNTSLCWAATLPRLIGALVRFFLG